MDLSVKPANEIKTREQQEGDIVEVNDREKNPADIPLPSPKVPSNGDIFDAPVKATLSRMKKQRETLAKTRQRLTLKEKRLELKRQKEELKAQRQRIKEGEAEYKKTHPRKPRTKRTKKVAPKVVAPKVVAPKVGQSIAPQAVAPKKVAPKVATAKHSTEGGAKHRQAGIKGLTEEELHTLYGVFAQAQKNQKTTAPKPKPKPKPTINYINPIEQHAFSHLNNPFNF